MGTMMSAAAWGPDTARLDRALDHVRDSVERIDSLGRRTVWVAAFDSLQREIRQRTGVTLDVDSLAGGYALDRAALALAALADSALLDLGGQFLWIGPRGTRRAVGIADPDNSLRALATVEMRGGSVSTSSRERQPGTARSVTVLAPSALTAAAWSRALGVLGCDSVLALAPPLARRQVSVVCADSGAVRWTADLEGRVLLPTVPAAPAPAP